LESGTTWTVSEPSAQVGRRSPAEDFAHQVRLALVVEAVEAGVADRLLVGWHHAIGGLGEDAGQDTEQPQDDEGAGVGGGREDGREEVPGGGNFDVDERDDTLVDVKLGHALWRVGEIAEDRRDPLFQEDAVGVVAGVVDRTLAWGWCR